MKYFYFNPKDFDEEYHVMAEDKAEAWAFLEAYLNKKYKEDPEYYSGKAEHRIAHIRATYMVYEFDRGQVNVTEVS